MENKTFRKKNTSR